MKIGFNKKYFIKSAVDKKSSLNRNNMRHFIKITIKNRLLLKTFFSHYEAY